MYLYEDDAKIYNIISSANDSDCLQRVIDRVKYWCDEWLLTLNINKCCTMMITPRIKLDTTYCIKYKEDRHNIHKVGRTKDLGVLTLYYCSIKYLSITVTRDNQVQSANTAHMWCY